MTVRLEPDPALSSPFVPDPVETNPQPTKLLLQVGDRSISADEIVPLLAGYRLLPQLIREIIIDQAIADYSCSFEETVALCKRFYEQNQITSEPERQAWLTRNQLTMEQLEALVTREQRLEQFKQATWGNKLEPYFLQRKPSLDRVIYSLLRVKDSSVAQELFFRIQDGEQTFEELAREYSQGPEAQTGGLVGPVELTMPHPDLAKVLAIAEPGALQPPMRLGEWIAIVRLEKRLPAAFDEAMQKRLLNEQFETWIRERLKQETDRLATQRLE